MEGKCWAKSIALDDPEMLKSFVVEQVSLGRAVARPVLLFSDSSALPNHALSSAIFNGPYGEILATAWPDARTHHKTA